MAARGAKPKPAHLRLIDGTRNVTRHGTEEDLKRTADAATAQFGDIGSKPTHLKGEAAKAWAAWIQPAAWLDGSKVPAAIAFCELWQEFRGDPKHFTASKHGQMRAYMSELGLTDERNRAGFERAKPKDEFFDE